MGTISIKTIESKTAKYLRKANRLKPTHAKLERIDELMALIQTQFPPSNQNPETLTENQKLEFHHLQDLLELCSLHKLKFQIDAVISGIRTEIQQIKHTPDQLTQELFNALYQRLQTIIDIDVDYLEARELLHLLAVEYPQFIQDTEDMTPSLNIRQYKTPQLRIDLTCNLEDLEGHEALKAKYPRYQSPLTPKPQAQSSADTTSQCRMRFSLKNLKDLEFFHEELRVKSSYTVTINKQPITEQHFSDWLHCYKRFLNANNPRYCYGASPFTFNVFGCHKLYMPDIAKQLDHCWFHHGTLHQESGIFFISIHSIVEQLQQHLSHCGFCPALTPDKLSIGMKALPHYLNPECDPRWTYCYIQGELTEVIPVGNELAIAAIKPDFSHPETLSLIEVGSTPYIDKVLHYLLSRNPNVLREPAYSGLSTCIRCGSPYKLHTMTCSKCNVDFWKYALKNIEQALTQLRVVRDLTFQPRQVPPREAEVPRIAASQIKRSEGTSVSFDQLWNDPQVQEILSKTDEQAEPVRETPSSPQKDASSLTARKSPDTRQDIHKVLAELSASRKNRRRKTVPKPSPSERLQFHEKIWSLISHKYRERKAIETAFSPPRAPEDLPSSPENLPASLEQTPSPEPDLLPTSIREGAESDTTSHDSQRTIPLSQEVSDEGMDPEKAALFNAIKSLKSRQKSELSKRGVVRVIYHATMDKETCPLCQYLDGMVMDPDDPATDIFSPPLYPGCTCSREYVLRTEKPKNWPKVTFKFPPKELLIHLDKEET